MSDLTSRAAPSAPRQRMFELLLVAAALFETAHFLGLFERRAEVDGTAMAVLFTAAIPWVPVILGLLVTRRGSVVAKWLLLTLIVIAMLTAIRIGIARWSEPTILFGAIAGALQLAAAAILLTAGRDWTRNRAAATSPSRSS